MPRVRADNYDAKVQGILDSAAALFAKVGFPNAKMQDIAKACGSSKSMLYHYFPTKDDLLYAMLEEHLEKLIVALQEVAAQPGSSEERFLACVQVYGQKSAQARRRHVIAMNDLKYLPKSLQTPLLKLEVEVLDVMAATLRELNPALPESMYRPYTMMLLGTLNWTEHWYKPGGRMQPRELSERMSSLFLHGFLAAKDG